jgi:hypothetical protein
MAESEIQKTKTFPLGIIFQRRSGETGWEATIVASPAGAVYRE